jgi:hypothetical protein
MRTSVRLCGRLSAGSAPSYATPVPANALVIRQVLYAASQSCVPAQVRGCVSSRSSLRRAGRADGEATVRTPPHRRRAGGIAARWRCRGVASVVPRAWPPVPAAAADDAHPPRVSAPRRTRRRMTAALVQRCCSAAAALRALLLEPLRDAAAAAWRHHRHEPAATAAAAGGGCLLCAHDVFSGTGARGRAAVAGGAKLHEARRQRTCAAAANTGPLTNLRISVAPLLLVVMLLSLLPGVAAESPAVTLSYYWTYKVRCGAVRAARRAFRSVATAGTRPRAAG